MRNGVRHWILFVQSHFTSSRCINKNGESDCVQKAADQSSLDGCCPGVIHDCLVTTDLSIYEQKVIRNMFFTRDSSTMACILRQRARTSPCGSFLDYILFGKVTS